MDLSIQVNGYQSLLKKKLITLISKPISIFFVLLHNGIVCQLHNIVVKTIMRIKASKIINLLF